MAVQQLVKAAEPDDFSRTPLSAVLYRERQALDYIRQLLFIFEPAVIAGIRIARHQLHLVGMEQSAHISAGNIACIEHR